MSNMLKHIIDQTKRRDLEMMLMMSVRMAKILEDLGHEGWDRNLIWHLLIVMHNEFELDLDRMCTDLEADDYGSVMHDFGMSTKCIDPESFRWINDGGVPRYALGL